MVCVTGARICLNKHDVCHDDNNRGGELTRSESWNFLFAAAAGGGGWFGAAFSIRGVLHSRFWGAALSILRNCTVDSQKVYLKKSI